MSLFGKKKQTIDLLPEKEVQKQKSNFSVYLLLGLIIFLQIAAYAIVFLLNNSSQGNLTSLQNQELELQKKWNKFSAIATDVKQVKTKLGFYQSFNTTHSGLDKRLEKIASLVPDGVLINTITMNNKGKTTLMGTAEKPEDAYQMEAVIKETSGVSLVNLSSVSKKGSNYSFDINFEVK
jgi:Tfp pilus assembly protein PilN